MGSEIFFRLLYIGTRVLLPCLFNTTAVVVHVCAV